MAFQQHLTQQEINTLADDVQASIDYIQARPFITSGILAGFRNNFPSPVGVLPGILIRLDLAYMNPVERLIDGSVPLKVWLQNVLGLIGARKESDSVRAALEKVQSGTSGAPIISPAQAPEIKELIVHRDDMVPHEFMERGVVCARSVVKLTVQRFDNGVKTMIGANPSIYLGTGWLIGNGSLLITNHHVINARKHNETAASDADLKAQAAATTAYFDFDAPAVGGVAVPVRELLLWNAKLDYALLRIDDSGRPPLPLRAAAFTADEVADYAPVNIIQHPDGRPKQFAIRNNLVTAAEPNELRYFTDTDGGSSGSPVLDDLWRVAALHRGATQVRDVKFQGRDVAYVNVGTPLPAIVADIAARADPRIPALS